MEDYERSGQTFIAYCGSDISNNEIIQALEEKCPRFYTVKHKRLNDVIFAKIVYDDYVNDRDPYWNDEDKILTVNGYNQDEIRRACEKIYDINDQDKYHLITNYLYCNNKENMFRILSEYMHFCSVVYDAQTRQLVAGVTEANSKYTHLYYGYTKNNNELMFSNDGKILEPFCHDIKEMDKNTYMKDGELYTLSGDKHKDNSFIKNTKQNAKTILDGLNDLLIHITEESVRPKIEQNVEEYLSSDVSKEKVSDFISHELDGETKKQILEVIKNTVQDFSLQEQVNNRLNDSFDEKLMDYTKRMSVPVVHIVKLNDTVLGQTNEGFYHEKFEQILTQVQLDEPIMLIGPAGSGKNVAISQVADALGKHMYYTNNASNEFKLTGFIDAGGNYRDTEFYKAFKNGGIFFLDEIDNSDPSALIVINSALANGYMAFPHETIDRHPDFRIIAAANTWGKGADLQYVGRNALDGATLDRFDNIFFDYDINLESNLYPNDEVLEFMWAFRDAVYKSQIPHIVSTRGIGKVYKKEINEVPVQDILTSNVVKNLGQDDVNTIIGNMQNISLDNKYFDEIKRLRLSR